VAGETRARSRRRIIVLFLSVCLTVSAVSWTAGATADSPGGAESTLSAETAARLDAAVAVARAQADASGALIGVWAPWAGNWVVAQGTTARGGHTPLTTSMRFRIGTNTTAMTCTVLLRLVDEGIVQLADPVSRYLNRDAGLSGITLGQLCQGTSGIADFTRVLTPQFVNTPERQWPPVELATNGLAKPRTMQPGEGWAQSDTGIVLLGMVLEAATSQNLDSLYQHYIFDPLGMADTSFPDPATLEIPGAHPHGYAAALDSAGTPACSDVRDETALSSSMAWAAGGVVSTLDDLKTWAQALATSRLLGPDSAAAQWATLPTGAGTPSWQGYGFGGWQLGPMRGSVGSIPGFVSAALVDPATSLTVVVMLNNSTAGAGFARALAQELAAIASTLPSSNGGAAPAITLPWTAEQSAAELATAPCPAAPAAAAPAG